MSKINTHVQEPTQVPSAQTVVDREGSVRPTDLPIFGVNGINSTSPETLQGIDKRKPIRREETIDSRLTPATIPPDHTNRTLILCFDGTGDQFDGDNSNIIHFVSLLKKNDKTKQMVYYQAGIGTYTSSKAVNPLKSGVSKVLDEMFAWNLDDHVMSGYGFLMQNYIAGDSICIFGFSRGAYTARSLSGMLHKVGLLPADNFQQVPFAYKMYTRADSIGWEQSNAFKRAFSVDVRIDFLGVWDTVDSVGLIQKRLPFTTSNTIVRTFRHAISLDERRAKFKANLWNLPTEEENNLGLQSQDQLPNLTRQSADTKDNFEKLSRKESENDRVLDCLEKLYSEREDTLTDVEEVWFAGCHGDVGGGSVSNKTRYSLSRIPLRWMVRECFKAKTGIMFDPGCLRRIGLDPSTLYPYVTPRPLLTPATCPHIRKSPESMLSRLASRIPKKSRSKVPATVENGPIGTEEEEELQDALSPAYDQLQLKPYWWILEILPLNLRYQRANGEWVSYTGSNFANPRVIPKQKTSGVKIHRSVKMRMDATHHGDHAKQGKKYSPKAVLRVEPTWVD